MSKFVLLTPISYIKSAMDNAGLFKSKTMQEVFDDLDVIEKLQVPGEKAYYSEITEKQRQLYMALGIAPPT